MTEPDVLRFPVSLVTAAALADAITAALALKYEYEAEWDGRERCMRRSGYGGERGSGMWGGRVRRAERAAEGVVEDIRGVLGISEVSDDWGRLGVWGI